MDEANPGEEHEATSTPHTRSAPPTNLEHNHQQPRPDTKKAYSQPTLNGSPGFSFHEEEGDVVFSPVRRLEFSSGNDETKQSDLASITQELSFSMENLGNFDNFGEPPAQIGLDKENGHPDNNDFSALVISNVQCADSLSILSPEKTVLDTLHDRQSLPAQGVDCLDKKAVPLLSQTQKPDLSAADRNIDNCTPETQRHQQRLDNEDRHGYYLSHPKLESDIPLLTAQEHRYPADGRNKQTAKHIVTSSGQSVSGSLLPARPTNLRTGVSYPPLVRTVPYGAEREEKKRSKSQVMVSSMLNRSVKPKSPSNAPDNANLAEMDAPSNDGHTQFSPPKTMLTVVPDRTKFMQGGSKGDIEACPRPEDMPGGAVHEIELLRGQLQSAIQVPLKSQIDTDLFDYSQNGTGPKNQSDQIVSAISDMPSISTIDATDSVSWLMDYANHGLAADEPTPQLLEPVSSNSSSTNMLSLPVGHSLQPGHYRQMPSTNHSQYTAYLDNIKLKEELEKERFRRRHCEKYIEQLNAKLLDVQEQLAIAVSANRKKEILVEHLDKQLGKIMSTWKSKDAEKTQLITDLQKEKSFQEQIIEDQRKLTTKMRDDFSDMMEELNKEKEKTSRVIRKLEEMETHQKSLEKQLSNEKEQNREMIEEWEYQSERLRTSEQIINELNNQIEQEQSKSINREQELLKKIEEITESHRNLQETEKEQAEELRGKVSKSESQILSIEKELSEVKLQLENASRENDGLKVEIGILEAKHENNQKQLETRLESQMEKEITAIIEDVHKKRESFENRLQEEHKKQIIDLNEHHSAELNALLQKYQMELKQNEQKFTMRLQHHEHTLKTVREENTCLKIFNQRLESQRTEALNKFQNIMQLHWNEAISILGGSTNLDSQAFSEATERSPESVISEGTPVPPPLFPVREPEHYPSTEPNQEHPHPQTSSPKKDGLNISSFTISSEQISSMASGHRRAKLPSEADPMESVPNYLKGLPGQNMEERNHVLHNSERAPTINEMQENSKSQNSGKPDMTLLEPDTNILWYEKDSLQPSFIQTGPYMTAVPVRSPVQQDRQSHFLTSANRSANGKTSDPNSRPTSVNTEIQGLEYCHPDSELTPPIKQSPLPKDESQNNVLTEAARLKDDYQVLSERLMQQNSRQEELQHFIQMLLNRIPSAKNFPTMNPGSTKQDFEESQSEFQPLEVTSSNSTRMGEVINISSQSQEKPERLVQAPYYPSDILPRHQQQAPAMASCHPGVNQFPPGCHSFQDIQRLLEIYKTQENNETLQPNFEPIVTDEKHEGEKGVGQKKRDFPGRTVSRSNSLAKQPVRHNKPNEIKSKEKMDVRKNRYSRAHEKKKNPKTSGSGSNSSNTSGGNPIWK